MPEKSSIPLHYLKEDTDHELFLRRMDETVSEDISMMEAHRDDHCNFFFHEKGTSRFMLDFREVSLDGCAIFCILPGQVHRPLSFIDSSGWFMAVDLSFLSENQRSIFENYVLNGQPVTVNDQQAALLGKSFQLLSDISGNEKNVFYQPVFRSMLQVCLEMFASIFQEQKQSDPSDNLRPAIITRQFKSMLLKDFKILKSPSEYAHQLNITPSYLNEVVKITTGFSVSHWIHREVILESKRLLYYTNLSVKEIAFSVGYEDHTYFSRLFRKVTQSSPGQFRSQYRK